MSKPFTFHKSQLLRVRDICRGPAAGLTRRGQVNTIAAMGVLAGNVEIIEMYMNVLEKRADLWR